MPAFFQEVFASAGVDEDAKSSPGMIVSVAGSNVARLAGGKGLRLKAPRTLKIEELSPIPSAILIALLSPFNVVSLLKPGALADARYLRISGSAPIGPQPAQVKAVAAGKSRPEAVNI